MAINKQYFGEFKATYTKWSPEKRINPFTFRAGRRSKEITLEQGCNKLIF